MVAAGAVAGAKAAASCVEAAAAGATSSGTKFCDEQQAVKSDMRRGWVGGPGAGRVWCGPHSKGCNVLLLLADDQYWRAEKGLLVLWDQDLGDEAIHLRGFASC